MSKPKGPRGRDAGAGSIYIGVDDRYHARIYLRDGRRVSWRRPTREQAEAALAEMIELHKDELGAFTHKRVTGYYVGEMRRVRPPRSGVSPRVRWAVLDRDGFRCVYCGCTAEDGVRLVIDHIQPVADGGTDDIANLATACDPCNRGKASSPLRNRPPSLALGSDNGSETPDSTLSTHESHNTAGIGTGVDERA